MTISTLITADEMRSRGLPSLEIRCVAHIVPALFIDSLTPLYFNGPPGGPDFVSVQVIQLSRGETFSLDEEVAKHNQPGKNFVLGDTGEFEIAGRKYPVRCWSIKVTPWLDARATAFIEIPEVGAVVLITFSAWKDADNRLTTRHLQRRVLETLTLTPVPR